MSIPLHMSGSPDRKTSLLAGVRVEIMTVVWMVIEAAIAISAGILARSVLLTSFGLDSLIELVTAAVLLWRLTAETRHVPTERVERAEVRAAWITGVALVLLCIYILATSGLALALGLRPERSYVGIGLALSALIVMPLLVRSKRRIAGEIQSSALRADAACSVTCAYMAAALLVGLALNAVFGWWWADSVAALGLLYWIGSEAREALLSARDGVAACACCQD
jgi:divalent metal cation (Fe/Co/Zn/Cd) transporter